MRLKTLASLFRYLWKIHENIKLKEEQHLQLFLIDTIIAIVMFIVVFIAIIIAIKITATIIIIIIIIIITMITQKRPNHILLIRDHN